jgi:hypothetical protein
MKRNAYSFDPLCLELASHFLPDGATEDAKQELAQVIQDAVEAHLLSPVLRPVECSEEQALSLRRCK